MSRKSLTLPGMKSDWEIDPDELEICRRTDGTEWELGSGASARVRLHGFFFHLLARLWPAFSALLGSRVLGVSVICLLGFASYGGSYQCLKGRQSFTVPCNVLHGCALSRPIF